MGLHKKRGREGIKEGEREGEKEGRKKRRLTPTKHQIFQEYVSVDKVMR